MLLLSITSSAGIASFTIPKNSLSATSEFTHNQRTEVTGDRVKNIIITPPALYHEAKQLEDFHTKQGIFTVTFNTSWIYKNYKDADDPTYPGYANRIIPRIFVKNYNYSLAKRIIRFLRDLADFKALEYITLFGNGKHVPPSYYFHTRGRMNKYWIFPDFYNNIIASDFLYSSPDYNLDVDYKVGRLSVSSRMEAAGVVNKIIAWKQKADWDWFSNAIVSGDQVNHFESMSLRGCYAGEMIAVDAINRGYFDPMQVTKLFWTEGLFHRKDIIAALEEGNTGFFYMMAHGSVDRWGTYLEPPGEDNFISVSDLLDMPTNHRVPVIVSVACMSGAFDSDLAWPTNLQRGVTTFGEAVLQSPGAGIAYVGTTRATLGAPVVHLENGEVQFTDETGIAGMLTSFFETYRNRFNHLGDLTYHAMKKYVADYKVTDNHESTNEFAVLVSFTLLGDPALELPLWPINQNPAYRLPDITAVSPVGYTDEEYSRPFYYTNDEITIRIETEAPQVNIKLIKIDEDTVIKRDIIYPENFRINYNLTLIKPAEYLLRAESPDGKESWLYFSTVDKKDPTMSSLLL